VHCDPYMHSVSFSKGDLATKKIYPTLWWLYRDRLLPSNTAFYGYARSKLTIEELRKKCHQYMKVSCKFYNILPVSCCRFYLRSNI
jgi:glucose-6-phosphate 1-dehydrogenase